LKYSATLAADLKHWYLNHQFVRTENRRELKLESRNTDSGLASSRSDRSRKRSSSSSNTTTNNNGWIQLLDFHINTTDFDFNFNN
jgi:hypothetical protein